MDHTCFENFHQWSPLPPLVQNVDPASTCVVEVVSGNVSSTTTNLPAPFQLTSTFQPTIATNPPSLLTLPDTLIPPVRRDTPCASASLTSVWMADAEPTQYPDTAYIDTALQHVPGLHQTQPLCARGPPGWDRETMGFALAQLVLSVQDCHGGSGCDRHGAGTTNCPRTTGVDLWAGGRVARVRKDLLRPLPDMSLESPRGRSATREDCVGRDGHLTSLWSR